jgi:hypothetical protein
MDNSIENRATLIITNFMKKYFKQCDHCGSQQFTRNTDEILKKYKYIELDYCEKCNQLLCITRYCCD